MAISNPQSTVREPHQRTDNLIKRAVRGIVPRWVLDYYRTRRWGHTWFDFEERSRREVFTHIYQTGMWGQGEGTFYSGPGSDVAVTKSYVEAVREFIARNGITSVVDLGCGDFRVGAALLTPELRYHGVDIVEGIVAHNQNTHGSASVAFSCRDAVVDNLPPADLCLIREVFQHLSNEEIGIVLKRCRQFPFVVVTERVASPEGLRSANMDIAHGPYIRADHGSGVFLDAPPFNERIAATLVETAMPNTTVLKTILIDNRAAATGAAPAMPPIAHSVIRRRSTSSRNGGAPD